HRRAHADGWQRDARQPGAESRRRHRADLRRPLAVHTDRRRLQGQASRCRRPVHGHVLRRVHLVGATFRAMSQAGRAPKATYELALLPGDGIGQEVIADARALLDIVGPATGVSFALEEIPCGGKFYLEHGSRDWPEGAEERCAAADAILLGAVGWSGPDGSPV